MPPAIASGMPASFSVSSVMTPSVPFGADDQPREVVTGRRFLGAPRRGHHLAVRHHHLERQHVVLHGAVAHRVGARAARRRHAAERGVGAGVDREEHALVAQMFVERLAGDARLDHAVEILGVHGEHPVHVAEIDRHAALRRVDVTLERGAGPNGMTGTRCAAQMRTISCTSAVDCGKTTASGGWFSIQVMVLPCCSRTACEVTSRLPKCRGQRVDRQLDGLGVASLRRRSSADIAMATG